MKISDLETKLALRPLIAYKDTDLEAGYTSDLLSDVMANAPSESVLITIMGHKNTVAVATLAGIKAIVLAGSSPATADMLTAATAEGIAVFSSKDNQFTLSHQIAQLLTAP